MKTTEIIEGNKVVIDWEFKKRIEELKSDWYLWSVEGKGDDGKTYWGNCEAGDLMPDNYRDCEVQFIEEIETEKPARTGS